MRFAAAWSLLLLILVLSAFSQASAQRAEKILVVVTAPPLGSVVEEVGGDLVEVRSILPPGAEPHSYEPGIQELISSIQDASLIVMTGPHHLPVEEKIQRLSEEGFIRIPILDYRDYEEMGLMVLSIPQTGAPNPHGYVYSIRGLKAIAKACVSELSRIYPEGSGYFNERLKAYLQRLTELEKKLGGMNVGDVKIILGGPVLQYVAEDLGLKVERIIMHGHGVEPSSEDVMEAIKLAKGSGKFYVLLSGIELSESSTLLRALQENNVPYIIVPLMEISDRPELAPVITATLLRSNLRVVEGGRSPSSISEILFLPSLLANLVLGFFLILLILKVRRYG
ncbi:MAG: hypothetical protein DRN54_03415 [Thaumarchaeota archaeon]|nr:MAG: hypothetical protein DRN54_03415 [Nitrososphaerota archaeon]